MSYYLIHHFDEKRDYQDLKPIKTKLNNSVLFDMGYVQNAIKKQLLAQIIPLEEAVKPNKKYILEEPTFPVGPNTYVDPLHPEYLLASVNGYVFYHEGLITVKRTLNVRKDVNFSTGNIFFVGDTAIHGAIRAGFEVQSNNILIKDVVEGGIVRARQDIAAIGGVRGGAGQHCLIAAGGNLKAAFIERAQVRAEQSMLIDKYCMHSTVYCGGNLAVKGRLVGGTVNANSNVYVGEQLGNNAAVPTKVFLGYNPMQIRVLQRVDNRIAVLSDRINHLKGIAGHLEEDANDASRSLAQKVKQRKYLISRRNQLWKTLYLDEQIASRCQLVVPGTVYPGTEVAIGRSYLEIDKVYTNVIFRQNGDEIVAEDLRLYVARQNNKDKKKTSLSHR